MSETNPPDESGGPIDFLATERLLLPISENEPAGVSLRYEGIYDKIREAAREDDPSLPQGVWQRELKRADWRDVGRLCFDALENRSKDIQLAAWLLEALLHLHEFEGLDRGLKLLLELCERFWDVIHPEIDEDDPEVRLFPFLWLDEKLPVKLKLRPVTMPPSGEVCDPVTFLDYERNHLAEKLPEKETRELMDRSIKATPIGFHKKQSADIGSSLKRLSTLERYLDEKCGRDAPGFSQLRETLESIKHLSDKFLKEKAGRDATTETEENGNGDDGNFNCLPDEDLFETFGGGLRIKNRSHAYHILGETADYLAMREPHSPVPLLLKRAISWGNMDFPELLREIVTDGSVLKQVMSLLKVDGGEESPK